MSQPAITAASGDGSSSTFESPLQSSFTGTPERVHILLIGCERIEQLQRAFEQHRPQYQRSESPSTSSHHDVQLITLPQLLSEILGLSVAEAKQVLQTEPAEYETMEEEKDDRAEPSFHPSSHLNISHLASHPRLTQIKIIWICHLEDTTGQQQQRAWMMHQSLLHMFTPPSKSSPASFSSIDASSALDDLPFMLVGLSAFSEADAIRYASPSINIDFARSIHAIGCTSLSCIDDYFDQMNSKLRILIQRAIYVTFLQRFYPDPFRRRLNSKSQTASNSFSIGTLTAASAIISPPTPRVFSDLDDFHLLNCCIEISHAIPQWSHLTIHSSTISDIGLAGLISTLQGVSHTTQIALRSINITRAFQVNEMTYLKFIQSLSGFPLTSITIAGNTIMSDVSPKDALLQVYSEVLQSTPLIHFHLTHLPDTFFSLRDLTKIQHLDLSHSWSDITELSNHPFRGLLPSLLAVDSPLLSSGSNLQQLSLAHNSLTDDLVCPLLERLATHPTLTTLNLSHNRLTNSNSLVWAFKRIFESDSSGGTESSSLSAPVSKLISLDLSFNLWAKFPSTLYLIPLRLRYLNLRNNPIRNIPHYILHSATPNALLDYLSLLRTQNSSSSSTSLSSPIPKRIRLMLIGHGAAGKTFLKDTLLLKRETASASLSDWTISQSIHFLREKGVQEDVCEVLERKSFSGCNLDERDLDSLRCDLTAMLAADEELLESVDALVEIIEELQIQADQDGASGRNIYTSTVGVLNDSFIHRITTSAGQSMDVIVDVLDFAGQQEYFVSHSLFLADIQAIYILVNNVAKKSKLLNQPKDQETPPSSSSSLSTTPTPYEFNSEYETQIHFWLSFLRSLFPLHSTIDVTLVQTHVDQLRQLSREVSRLPDPSSLQQSLRAAYGTSYSTLDVLQLDYSQADGSDRTSVTSVRQALLDKICAKALEATSPWALIESKLAEWLSSLRAANTFPVVPINELSKRIREADPQAFGRGKMEPQQVLALLQSIISHSTAIGLILPVMSLNVVILDPLQWFSHCIAAFISLNTSDEFHRDDQSIHSIRSLDGMVEWIDIRANAHQLLCKTDEQLRLLMSLLTHLGLCYPMEPVSSSSPSTAPSDPSASLPTRYLFPCLLPSDPRQFDTIQSFMNFDQIETRFNETIRTNYFARRDYINSSIATSASSTNPILAASSLPFCYPSFNARGPSRFIFSIVGRDWLCGRESSAAGGTSITFPPTFFPQLQVQCLKRFGTSCTIYGQGFICIQSNGSKSMTPFEKGFIQLLPAQRTIRVVAGGYAPQILFSSLIDVVEQSICASERLDSCVVRMALCRFCLSMLCFPQRQTGSMPREVFDHLPSTSITSNSGIYARFGLNIDQFQLCVRDQQFWNEWKCQASRLNPIESNPLIPRSANYCWMVTGAVLCKVSKLEQDGSATVGDPLSVSAMERALDPVRHVFFHPAHGRLYLFSSYNCAQLQFNDASVPSNPINECPACTFHNTLTAVACIQCRTPLPSTRREEKDNEEGNAHAAAHLHRWNELHPTYNQLSTSKLSGDEIRFLNKQLPIFPTERSFPSYYDTICVLSDDEGKKDELFIFRDGHYWKKDLSIRPLINRQIGTKELGELLTMPPYYPRPFVKKLSQSIPSSASLSLQPTTPLHSEWQTEIYPFIASRQHLQPTSTSTPPITLQLSPDVDYQLMRRFALRLSTLSPPDSAQPIHSGPHSIVSIRTLRLDQLHLGLLSLWRRNPTLKKLINFKQPRMEVVVKTIQKPKELTWFQFIHQFIREVEINLRLHSNPHPNILPIMGYTIQRSAKVPSETVWSHTDTLDDLVSLQHQPGEIVWDEIKLSMVFPHIHQSLERYIAQRREFTINHEEDLPILVDLLSQATSSMQHCHHHHLHIIHSDISIRNFLIDRDHIYLCDFGSANILPNWSRHYAGSSIGPLNRLPSASINSPLFKDVPSTILNSMISFNTFSERTFILRRVCRTFNVICDQQIASFGMLSPFERLELNRLAPEVLTSHIYSRSTDVYQFGRLMTEILGIWPCELSTTLASPEEWLQSNRVSHGLNPNVQVEYHRWPRQLCGIISSCFFAHPDHRPTMADISAQLHEFKLALSVFGKPLLSSPPTSLSTSARYFTSFIDGTMDSTAHYVSLDRMSPTICPRASPSEWPANLPNFIETVFQHPLTKEIYLVAGEWYWKLHSLSRIVLPGYPKKIPSAWNWPIVTHTTNSSGLEIPAALFSPWKYAPLSIFSIKDSLFLLKGDLLWKIIGSPGKSANIDVDDLTIDPNPTYPKYLAEFKSYSEWTQQQISLTVLNMENKSAASVAPSSPLSSSSVKSLNDYFRLGECYLFGHGSVCPRNLARATEIFRTLAHVHNYPLAWYRLGCIHVRQAAVDKTTNGSQGEDVMSAAHFVRAAQFGVIPALSWVYRYGWSPYDQNPSLTRKYAQLAIVANPLDPIAYSFLASILQTKPHRDLSSALQHYDRAFTLGDDTALEPLSLLLVSVHPTDVGRAMMLVSRIREPERRVAANRQLLELLDAIRLEQTNPTFSNKPWNCSACTYLNHGSDKRCLMCSTDRPPDETIEEDESKEVEADLSSKSTPLATAIINSLGCRDGIIPFEKLRAVEELNFTYHIPDLPDPSQSRPSSLKDVSTAADFEQFYLQCFQTKDISFYSFNRGRSSDSSPLPYYSWVVPYEMRSFAQRQADEVAYLEAIEFASAMAALQSLLPPDRRLRGSDLELLDVLGSGLSSSVYRGMFIGKKYKGSMFAVKQFKVNESNANQQHLPIKQLFNHFKHELQIYLRLPKHPHLLDFFGVVLDQAPTGANSSASLTSSVEMKLVLQYMSKNSLAQVLSDPNGGLTLTWPNPSHGNLVRLISVLRECASSLAFLHTRGLIHCDIASRNFLIDGGWAVRICDFGLARFLPPNPNFDPDAPPKKGVEEFMRMGQRESGSGELLPVLNMAPECLLATSSGSPTPYTRASDIWSFGVMMWECFSGRPAWNEYDFPDLFPSSGGSSSSSSSSASSTSPSIISSTHQREQRLVQLIAKGHLRLQSNLDWPLEIRNLIERCLESNPKLRETKASMGMITEELTRIERELNKIN